MQELNPLSDVKKNIEWEINILSTLAPKLSLIGGKPDHDWCINEILFPMSKMLHGKRNIRLTLAPNTIVYKLPFFHSPNVELPLWHLIFFFLFFGRCQKLGVRFIHGCGLYNVNYGSSSLVMKSRCEEWLCHLQEDTILKSFISSVERQKGVNAVQRCSVENQKGVITVQSLWR